MGNCPFFSFFASFHLVYLILKRFLLPQRGCRWTGHLPLLQNLMEMNMVLVYIITHCEKPEGQNRVETIVTPFRWSSDCVTRR